MHNDKYKMIGTIIGAGLKIGMYILFAAYLIAHW